MIYLKWENKGHVSSRSRCRSSLPWAFEKRARGNLAPSSASLSPKLLLRPCHLFAGFAPSPSYIIRASQGNAQRTLMLWWVQNLLSLYLAPYSISTGERPRILCLCSMRRNSPVLRVSFLRLLLLAVIAFARVLLLFASDTLSGKVELFGILSRSPDLRTQRRT